MDIAPSVAIHDSIPHHPLSVDTALSFPVMSHRVIDVCKKLFRKWEKLDDSRFSVETVSGGITNLLLKVSVKEGNGDNVAVTVRLYGPNTEYVIDRKRELQAIKYLSAAGFGAKLLGVFGNGMVQSFINARTLNPADMKKPKLAAEIAKQLRRFHHVEIPGSKEPQLWVDIFKFFEKASSLRFEAPDMQRRYETISFKEVHEEVTQLKELTDRLNAPVVFSHNDLLSGNLMLDDEHGYECDYSLYPSKDEQFHFFRHYLKPEKPYEVPEKDLKALYIETNTFMLASHLYWALWALIQAKMSAIDFDYLGYFFLRYNQYKKEEQMCLHNLTYQSKKA
ncbi:putative ethanolamine kinase A [Gossypium arboreum]|uniref:ethanolamine kinase n=1 Tax=Gossypium arboreum TaxID=29729 RepID=A0A0B0Q140_GOSAR|nr:putative ethanolamine kinase A [Gossypium arboreum]